MAIYSDIGGGIGNIMCELACGLSLAHKLGVEHYSVTSNARKESAVVNKYFRDLTELVPRPNKELVPRYYERKVELLPEIDNIMIYGVRGNTIYYDEDYVKYIFMIKGDVKKYILSKVPDIKERISIHVRRGDYLDFPKVWYVQTMDYFNRAIGYFGRDKKYLVCSDDPDWCKTNFIDGDFIFSDFDGYTDLYAMSLCSNNIISNSSFSWWSWYLSDHSDRVAIRPENWYAKEKKVKYVGLDTSKMIIL